MLLDQYENDSEDEGKKGYLDLDSRLSVILEHVHDDSIITEIFAMKLTEEEIQEYMGKNIFSWISDKKYLSEDKVRNITVEDMAIERNEIFAQHRYIFQDKGLKAYSESTSWFEGTVPADQQANDFVLSEGTSLCLAIMSWHYEEAKLTIGPFRSKRNIRNFSEEKKYMNLTVNVGQNLFTIGFFGTGR